MKATQTAGLFAGTMVIVEDEPVIAMLIEEMAAELGWQVACAHSEQSAFELLATMTPTMAVLDVNLGLVNSFALAASCQDRGIPILFITGYTAMEIPEGCGNGPILAKPFSPEDFQIALGRCLGEKTSASNEPISPLR